MSFDFLESTDKEFSNYTPSAAWPVVVDEFVEYAQSKNPSKKNSSHDDNSSKTQTHTSLDILTGFDSTRNNFHSGARGVFSGLRNQGATCYLNSFLQAQFMTPEFRSGIYQFDCSSNYETFPIAYQLQRLFAKLQLTKKQAVSTRSLTKSFGWNSSDSFTQHDVQELSHVLFDALEEALTSSKQENLINNLYQGTLTDYVRCLTCNYQSQRSDKYLDISLDIHDVNTLEGALRKFIQPEILSGTSQWKCPKCNKLVDATKGLAFDSFPYILVTHLKRFDFNWNANQRVKLGHKVSFPFILDLQPFKGTNSNSNSISTSSEKKEFSTEDEKAVSLLRKKIDHLTDSINSDENLHQSSMGLVDFWRSERKKLQKQLEELLEKLQKEGKHIPGMESFSQPTTPAKMVTKDAEYKEGNYELYSVLVHSGSAMGGHYYAYIKSFEKNKWYNFNDYTVTEIPVQEIERSFGESSDSSYSSTAYVLLFRRIDSSRNINVVSDAKVPELAKQKDKQKYDVNTKFKSDIDISQEILSLGAGKTELGGKSEISPPISNDERDKPVSNASSNALSVVGVHLVNPSKSEIVSPIPKVEPKIEKTSSNEETGVELTTYSMSETVKNSASTASSKTNFYGIESGDEVDEEEEDDSISITFYTGNGKSHSTVVSCNETTLKQLLEAARAIFNLEESIDQIRFRKYHVKARYPLEYIEGEYDQYLIEIGIEDSINLYVEIRKENEKFPVYDRSNVMFRIILFNEGSLTTPSANELLVPRGSSIGQLKECISKKYSVPKPTLRLFRVFYQGNQLVELLGDELRLADDFDLYLGETIHAGYNTLGLPWNPLQKLEFLTGRSLQTTTQAQIGVGGGAAVGFPPALGDVGGVASMLIGMKNSYSDKPRPSSGPKEKGIKIKKRAEKKN